MTLADGGVNPLTREGVIDQQVCRYTLTVMTTAGLYETSGDWLYDVVLPVRAGSAAGSFWCPPARAGPSASWRYVA